MESFADLLGLEVEDLSKYNESQLLRMSNADFPETHGGSKVNVFFNLLSYHIIIYFKKNIKIYNLLKYARMNHI